MAGASISERKRVLRRMARAGAAGRSPAAARRGEARLVDDMASRSLRCVALYAALPDEVPTARAFEALRARGVKVAFPRVEAGALELRRVDALSELRSGYRSVLEPSADRSRVVAERVDLFAVPGLAFDRSGGRLGRGGGHYDRLLARARPDAVRIGVCFDDQLVASVPRDEWDATMNVVITPGERILVP